MDDSTRRNIRIRERAIELARQTWVIEPKHGSGVVIVSHPGQELNRDPQWLLENFACRPDELMLLIDSREAPQPFEVGSELAAARARVAELERQSQASAVVEAGVIGAAKADVAKAEAKSTAKGA